jgi:preprotein translocase subunit SecF
MMYGWLWSRLPGPTWLRVLLALLAVLAVVAVCFEWVFPAIAPYMPFNDITVDE